MVELHRTFSFIFLREKGAFCFVFGCPFLWFVLGWCGIAAYFIALLPAYYVVGLFFKKHFGWRIVVNNSNKLTFFL